MHQSEDNRTRQSQPHPNSVMVGLTQSCSLAPGPSRMRAIPQTASHSRPEPCQQPRVGGAHWHGGDAERGVHHDPGSGWAQSRGESCGTKAAGLNRKCLWASATVKKSEEKVVFSPSRSRRWDKVWSERFPSRGRHSIGLQVPRLDSFRYSFCLERCVKCFS